MSDDRVRVVSTTINKKFTFSDYGFSHFVRDRMMEILREYDANNNALFEEEEIKNALIAILNENPNEVSYVVQNVFRYDKDGDRAVTYKEFVRPLSCRSISVLNSTSEN